MYNYFRSLNVIAMKPFTLGLVILCLICFSSCNEPTISRQPNTNNIPNISTNTVNSIPANHDSNFSFNSREPNNIENRDAQDKRIRENLANLKNDLKNGIGYNSNPPNKVGKGFNIPCKIITRKFNTQSTIEKLERTTDCKGSVISAKVYLRDGKIYDLEKNKIRNLEKATEQEILKMIR